MMTPCIVKNLLYVSGSNQVGLRRRRFQTNQARERTANEEEKRDRDQIQNRDALWSPVSSQLSKLCSLLM